MTLFADDRRDDLREVLVESTDDCLAYSRDPFVEDDCASAGMSNGATFFGLIAEVDRLDTLLAELIGFRFLKSFPEKTVCLAALALGMLDSLLAVEDDRFSFAKSFPEKTVCLFALVVLLI